MKRSGLVFALLLAAASAGAFASRLWAWILDFNPGFEFVHAPVPTGGPLTSGVTILLVDGLRLDGSRHMPVLNDLRARGADIEATAGTPSFSRPGRASIAVGAPQGIHGVTTNRQQRAIPLDNILRRLGEMGGTCRVAGSGIWKGLFRDDIARCGVYRGGEGKEGPGAFDRQVPSIRASDRAGLEFVLEKPATLRIADVISTDFAAHEYGGASIEYQAELVRTDDLIAGLVTRLDLSKETLIVTADHGHRDAGGHGGEEPEVLSVPIVMIGAGVRPGVALRAQQADIAPTVAALLGIPLPAASAGRPMVGVIATDEAGQASIEEASRMQRAAFTGTVAARLGVTATWPQEDLAALVSRHRTAEIGRRLKLAAGAAALVIALTALVLRLARADLWSLLAAVGATALLLLGPIGARIPAMSFSAINYDEMLIPFFIRILALAMLTTLGAIAAALVVGHVFRRRPTLDTPVVRAGGAGLLLTTTLVLAVITWWWRQALLDSTTLPGPGAMVQSFALTLAAISAAATTLVVMLILRIVAASRSRSAPERA